MRLCLPILTWTVVLCYLLNPLTLVSGYITYAELLTSVVPNEPMLNTFYFWWVHATYLSYVFSSFALVALSLSRTRQPLLGLLAVCFMFVLWASELSDLIYSNSQLMSLTTLSTSVNVLLANALNKYHPFIFYSSVALLFLVSLRCFGLSSIVRSYQTTEYSKQLILVARWAVGINLFAIFLGSWWAMQEGTWGGWWNWDSSEMFGLLPTFCLLKLVHSTSKSSASWSIVLHFIVSVTVVVGCYFLLQLNFDLISHNFGARFFYFFNSNLVFVSGFLILLGFTVLLLFVILTWRIELSSIAGWFGSVKERSYFQATYPPVLTPLLLSLWLLYSFFDFIEASKSVVLAFIVIIDRLEFRELNMVLLVVLSLLFSASTKPNDLSCSRGFSYFSLSVVPLNLGSGALSFNSPKVFHVGLILFTVLTLFTNKIILKQWVFTPDTLISYGPTQWLSLSSGSFTVDSWSVEETRRSMSTAADLPLSWRRWDLSNYSQSDLFDLVSTSWESSASLRIDSGYGVALISISSLWLPNLMTLTILLFSYYYPYALRP